MAWSRSRRRNVETAGGLICFTANFEQPKEKGNRQGLLYTLDPAA
jgi:hypothetical protein